MPATREAFGRMVGDRVRVARRDQKMTQEQLSEKMGFKDRQILSNIEAGKRRVQADELVEFMQVLGKDIDFFTDPYRLVEDRVFSWRATAESELIDAYEAKARIMVSAYRRFKVLLGEPFTPLPSRLNMTKKSSYEDAVEAGERVAQWLEMGEIPACVLHERIEQNLHIPVLFVDPPSVVSGAACRLPEAVLILINRSEPSWRRNFDLAHELFHVLTWDQMRPNHIELRAEAARPRPREEILADNFAGGLLMPRAVLSTMWENREGVDIAAWVNMAAVKFQVSGTAMFHRIKNLGWISREDEEGLDPDRLVRSARGESTPKPYSSDFAELVYRVLERGLVSRRKMTEILDCTVEDVEHLLSQYGKQMPY